MSDNATLLVLLGMFMATACFLFWCATREGR
jgi:hypothetical protein